jgi:sulfoxide reductase heme-binding subunit YedZ
VSDRYRRVERPLLLLAVAAPLAWLVAAGAGAWGLSLGPNPVKETIHFSGKTALNLLLITLLVSPLRAWTGWNGLQRWRRILGVAAFTYALLHFLAYAVLELNLDFSDLGREIARRPYITVGLAALLMLLPLAATSADRAMRRLGRRWAVLHRLAYPATVLAAWHFHWQVRAGLVEPLLYWAALALLLGWRVKRAWERRVTSPSGPARAPGRT